MSVNGIWFLSHNIDYGHEFLNQPVLFNVVVVLFVGVHFESFA